MDSPMKRFFITSITLIYLTACATIIDDQTQKMTIHTPGVESAKCHIQNQDFKYAVWNDQEIEIMKSPHDLVINCKAHSNREKTVHVKRGINEWVVANVSNGFIPGATYDYFSRGAFNYPENITVDFTGMKPASYPEPDYEAHQNHKIESYAPTTAITDQTKNSNQGELKKLDKLYEYDFKESSQSTSSTTSLHRQYNAPTAYDPREEDK